MSIAGRNAIRGSRVTIYRPERTDAPEGGGRKMTRWRPLAGRLNTRLELLPTTDAVNRLVFGAETTATLMAMVDRRAGATDPLADDGIEVQTGHYAGYRFVITRALPMKRAIQVGLASTTEVFP